jgi:hypothetical protein
VHCVCGNRSSSWSAKDLAAVGGTAGFARVKAGLSDKQRALQIKKPFALGRVVN